MRYRIIIFVVVGLLVLVGLLGFLFGRKSPPASTAQLEFWGTDSPAVWETIISAYQTANPGVGIKYVQKNSAGYEKELLNSLASGRGPDIVFIQNTWLNKHLNKLSPAPPNSMNIAAFKDVFMDVATKDLIRSGQVYAVPFYVDTLGLYYNKSLYNNAGLINSPKTWEEFNQVVKQISQKDDDGNIIRSGAALGTAGNVNYASDILQMIMLQTGAVMISPDGREAVFDRTVSLEGRPYSPAQTALDFYTSFAVATKPVYAWNARMQNSLKAFTTGQTAMYIGYSRDLKAIKDSGINFGVASLPQIKDTRRDPSYLDINWASYQAGAVTQTSANKNAAWNFLIFASSRNAAGTYLTATYLPPARKDLIEFTASDAALNVFAKQSLTAANWPQPDEVEVKKIFERMINAVALGQSTPANAIKEAAIE
ncbi:MAG: extracellular solute-binding protein, partial [Patescibacteria group bacterium]